VTTQKLQLTPAQTLLKRVLDVVISTALLIIIAPVLLYSSILVKLDGPGPIIYKYRRFGPDGREIYVYRFRTMRINSENTPIVRQATQNDPRITRVGRFLRSTALDELPSIINVLRGDMSIVGPRPKHVGEYDYYKSIADTMIHAKPGITSISRGFGFYTIVPNVETMRLLYEQEKAYIQNWSIWLDLKIIGQTIGRAFFDSNAY